MDAKLTVAFPYRDFFVNPIPTREKHYEILRARFIEMVPVRRIAKKFKAKFNSV